MNIIGVENDWVDCSNSVNITNNRNNKRIKEIEMEKQMKAVWAVLVMLTFWVTFNSTKVNNTASDQDQIDLLVANMLDRLIALEQDDEAPEVIPADEEAEDVSIFDDYSFQYAFAINRDVHGKGYVFEWRGREYTTDYLEEVSSLSHNNAIVGGWVLNGNDIDDFCVTNDRDECGECGGSGARDWYADRDGDGLGDFMTMKTSCSEPTAIND